MNFSYDPEQDAVVIDGLLVPVHGTRDGLTAAEYGILADAVRQIERGRLLYKGLSAEDADRILALTDDFFAFDAAARTE